MAQSVSNDALWEKLKEMDEKLNKLSEVRESPIPNSGQEEIKNNIHILGLSTDSQFKANRENIQMLNGNILSTLKEVSLIRKQQKGSIEQQKTDNSCFNFKFFKVRKMPFVVAIFGLLVFILTLFCMKQQNDYSLLMNEYRKQNVTIQKLNEELKGCEEKYSNKQQKNGVSKNKIQKIND